MPSRPHNAYSLLGVPLGASSEEIQAAYDHKMAECQDEPTDVLRALRIALDCLLNPTSRELYDGRAGVAEPRKRSPEVTVLSVEEAIAEKEAEVDEKQKAQARNTKRKKFTEYEQRFDKARENATLDKLNAMLDKILRR